MDSLAPVDVVIVGAGWAGMIMAKEIASRTPLSVLMLERGGPFRGYAAYAEEMDEVDTQVRFRHVESAAKGLFTSRSSYKDRANPIRQIGGLGGIVPGTGMGGTSDHWGATSPRLLPEAFNIATHLKETARRIQAAAGYHHPGLRDHLARHRALLHARRADDGD